MVWKNYWRHYSGPDYKLYFFAAVILILAIAVAYSGYKPQTKLPPTSTATTTTTSYTTITPPVPSTGTLVISLKGNGMKLQGFGTATSLTVSINSIDVSNGNVNDTNTTWINVYSGSKSVDLINHQNNSALIAQKDFTLSSYSKIRFQLNDSQIKIYYYSLGLYNKTYPLLATPEEVILPVDFSIDGGQKTVLSFVFDIPLSIFKEPDSNGVLAYKLKPKINVSQTVLELNDTVPNSETV